VRRCANISVLETDEAIGGPPPWFRVTNEQQALSSSRVVAPRAAKMPFLDLELPSDPHRGNQARSDVLLVRTAGKGL
jgi:hypothetical protein